MFSKMKRDAMIPIILGVVLIAAGVFVPTPGGVLTTYSVLDGKSANNYEFDDRYSYDRRICGRRRV